MNDATEFMYGGMRFVSSNLLPSEAAKLKLHPDCPCSDKFRREFDAWLLEMFGTKAVLYVMPNEGLVFANDVTLDAIRRSIANEVRSNSHIYSSYLPYR